MTVAGALAQGKTVISSKGAPWQGLVSHGCGWWIEQGAKALAAALDEAMETDPGRLATMGGAGRAWMTREFEWDSVGTAMDALYLWLRGEGPRPECVINE